MSISQIAVSADGTLPLLFSMETSWVPMLIFTYIYGGQLAIEFHTLGYRSFKKSALYDRIKQDIFQTLAVSIQQYEYSA